MSSDDLSIRVENLSKRYEIYSQPADRLKQMILPRVRRWTHRTERAYFREFWALRDVTFDIHRGETVGIIGANGAGKSTLLQLVCGTLYPTEGSLEVHGRIAALLELGAGFNPEFTGKENVYLSGLLYGISEGELRKRFDSIVAFANIGEFIDQPVKTYSSGMYVRLAFAIAAHVDADTLIVDEALSVGDVRFTQKCMRYLHDFQKRGTLLFVSHDAGAVTGLCSRAIWLDHGRMVMDGTARDTVESYLAAQHVADRADVGDTVVVRSRASANGNGSKAKAENKRVPSEIHDPRLGQLNGSAQRNLVQIFEFDPERINGEYGAGRAQIVDVKLNNSEGHPHEVITGGEYVDLVIVVKTMDTLDAPIFGFYVKDRLGQRLFGDNSYLTYHERPLSVAAGECLKAHFRFRMPILPNGDYSIDVALATGTQENHTQQHWMRDALVFKASESTMRYGLVGIPMHAIEIEQTERV